MINWSSSRPFTAATQDEHLSPQRLVTQSPRITKDSSRRPKPDVLEINNEEDLVFHSSDLIVTPIVDNPKVNFTACMSLISQKYKKFRNDTELLAVYKCIGFCHNEYTFKEKKCIFKVWIFVYVLIFCLYNNGHMIFVPPKCKHKQTSSLKSGVFCMKD